jgi:hypothetical protein
MDISPQQATIVENELKRLQLGLFETWRLYMSWYTWFFGANLIVLGWMLTRNDNAIDGIGAIILSSAWIIFNTTGFISTLRLRLHSITVTQKAESLSAILANVMPDCDSLKSNLGFPNDVGNIGLIANAISLLINILMWSYLLISSLLK